MVLHLGIEKHLEYVRIIYDFHKYSETSMINNNKYYYKMILKIIL